MIIIIIIIIISSQSRTSEKELPMTIVTELPLFTNAIKNSISEARKVQVLSLMIK